jgi:translation initiation factor eIF-2B subunit gamma
MPSSGGATVQAVVLAGAGGSRLHPLSDGGLPKVLLPVANRPLLTFPLRTLEEGGVTDVLVACAGDASAAAVRAWAAGYAAAGGALRVEVARVAEGLSSVAALRAILGAVRTQHFVLLSGDVVTEAPLRAQLLAHHARGAAATALLAPRAGAADGRPGRAPAGVDYIGLADGWRLVHYRHAAGAPRELRLPARLLARHARLEVTTALADMQVYVFATAALRAALEARPEMARLEEDLLPHLVRAHAGAPPAAPRADAATRSGSDASLLGEALAARPGSPPDAAAPQPWGCAAFVAPAGAYCRRANTLAGYADVNRDAASPELAPRLLREPASRFDNFVAVSAALGAKATVGPGCMVGEASSVGDKASVKRSVVGRDCALGAGARVINSVLMDGVRVGDGATVQNCILCGGVQVGEGASLRDCQLGPKQVVAPRAELNGEVRPRPRAGAAAH